MKKIILVMLMVILVATPCLAKEVEPEGLLSIEGTLWNACSVFIPPLYPPQYGGRAVTGDLDYGFHQGIVYRCNNAGLGYSCRQTDAQYIDTPVISILYEVGLTPPFVFLAIIQTSSVGIFSGYLAPISFVFGILFKTDDSWTPPEIE